MSQYSASMYAKIPIHCYAFTSEVNGGNIRLRMMLFSITCITLRILVAAKCNFFEKAATSISNGPGPPGHRSSDALGVDMTQACSISSIKRGFISRLRRH